VCVVKEVLPSVAMTPHLCTALVFAVLIVSMVPAVPTTSHARPVHPKKQDEQHNPKPIVLEKFPHDVSPLW
jgi:hypothetical protein